MGLRLLVFVLCSLSVLAVDLTVDLRTGEYEIADDVVGLAWLQEPYDPQATSNPDDDQNNFDEDGCNWRGLLKITFEKKTRKRAMLDLQFSESRGFSFHIGDSRTNDGFGGDNRTQQRDAEVHANGKELIIAGSDRERGVSNKTYGILHRDKDFVRGNMTVRLANQLFDAENGETLVYFNTFKLFALRGQDDGEGTVNYDLFLGLNRAVADVGLFGSGLCHVNLTWS